MEVILCSTAKKISGAGILHVCGGDPTTLPTNFNVITYSPRVWRWSYTEHNEKALEDGILHVCGGDPVIPENNNGFD